MENQNKKLAIVTGASSGLGRYFVDCTARDGYDVVVVARRQNELNELKVQIEERYGVKVHVFPKDLGEIGAGEEVYDFASGLGDIDVLINNAGFGDFGEYATRSWDKQNSMIQVNVTALSCLTRLCLPSMIKRNCGKILNVASIAAFEPGPLMSTYYATKAFVLSFSEALAVELKKTKVTVTALCPGPTGTGFEDAAEAKASGLFKNLSVADAEDVARYGYKKMKKGRVVVIPGFGNKLLPFMTRFAPRAIVRNLVYKIMRARRACK